MSRLEMLLVAEIGGRNTPAATQELLAADEEGLLAAAELVLRRVLDHVNEHESSHEPPFPRACEAARQRLPATHAESLLSGLLGLLQLNALLVLRRLDPTARADPGDLDTEAERLLGHTSVRKAVIAVYSGNGASIDIAQQRGALRQWVDPDSLTYHRSGTTSFILRCRLRTQVGLESTSEEAVLKCVLFPWNGMRAVADATRGYVGLYGGRGAPDVVVRPHASADRWVLMPFQAGDTLAAVLAGLRDKGPEVRLREARSLSDRLLQALESLARNRPLTRGEPARQHRDLSPSNVLVAPDGEPRFIDLGVNHLYTRQVGVPERDDSVYVAPEVTSGLQDCATSDLYSLGVILVEALSGSPHDGRVPDAVYEMSPALARVLEDLVARAPEQRLLLVDTTGGVDLATVRRLFDETFDLVEVEVPPTSWLGRWWARLTPSSREVRTQYLRWRAARERTSSGQSGQAAYLLFFSLIATGAWWFVFARTGLPNIDAVVSSLPKAPPAPDAAKLIAFAQGAVAVKYYQTVLARLRVAGPAGLLPRVTEVLIRLIPLVAVPTTLITVSWKPALWAWCCAAGAVAVAATNLSLHRLCTRWYSAASERGLSLVPPPQQRFRAGFEQWWWTMLIYALVIAVIALGLDLGWMRDEKAYVFGLLVISFGIHYVSKCALSGPAVRGSLARALVTGERLRLLDTTATATATATAPTVTPVDRAAALNGLVQRGAGTPTGPGEQPRREAETVGRG